MVELSLRVHPDEVCLVPERRQELTTEGGLDVAAHFDRLKPIINRLKQSRILVSLFVDPELAQIKAAADLAADYVELHTGTYANFTDGAQCAADGASFSGRAQAKAQDKAGEELEKLRNAAKQARALKLKPNAGHGLNYQNVVAVTEIPGLQWLHIGHSIIARALMVGMTRAVREMKFLINQPVLKTAHARRSRR